MMTKKRFRKVLGLIEDSNGDLLDLSEIADKMNQLNNENEQLKKDRNEMFIRERDAQNELRDIKKKYEQLKKEKEFWKGDACKYSNYLSILSMDCQIVQEAICDLKNVIDVDTEVFKLVDELDDKFDELNQHRLRAGYYTDIGKRYCKDCKHLGLDGMFGLICDAKGNNKNYNCPKYEEKKMTLNEFKKLLL